MSHPANKFIPDKAVSGELAGPKPVPAAQPVKVLSVVDARNGKMRPVILLEGKGLTKEADGRVIFVPGFPTSDIMDFAQAKSRFAVKTDGTIVYDPHGFIPGANPQFNLVDIAEIIKANN
jgi:hypothetical protein